MNSDSIYLLGVIVLNIIMKINTQSCSYGTYPDGDSCKECGLTSGFRIVNGQNAQKGAFPSVVFLMYYGDSLCTGTLISESTVLTAAHCVFDDTNATNYKVVYGVTDLNKDVWYNASVYEIIVHESYDGPNFLNDIALIILEDKVTLGPNVGVGCLPNFKGTFPTTFPIPVVAAGWGISDYENQLSPTVLQTGNLYITDPYKYWDFSTVKNTNGEPMKTNFTNQLVSVNINQGAATCQGDSGGPLFITPIINEKKRQVVVGINSYGLGDCFTYPGVKTNVKVYYDWILENMDY